MMMMMMAVVMMVAALCSALYMPDLTESSQLHSSISQVRKLRPREAKWLT